MDNNVLEKKIDLFLEEKRDEIVNNIIRLVNIESVAVEQEGKYPFGEGPAKAMDEALKLGQELGFTTENLDYYCGTVKYEKGEEEIGFFAHVDVVPAGNNWTYEPYNATVEGDYIIGRGSNDDKGPLVAALYTMLCCKELDLPLKRSLKLVFGGDEENGMPDLPHYINNTKKLPVFSIVADASFPVCYAEKGMLTATIKSKPILRKIVELNGGMVSNMVPDQAYVILKDTDFENTKKLLDNCKCKVEKIEGNVKITAYGKSTHAATPDSSVNAICELAKSIVDKNLLDSEEEKMMKYIIEYLSDFYGEGLNIAKEDDVTGKLTHIAGLLRTTEDNCITLNFNIRYPVCTNDEELMKLINDRVNACNFEVIDKFVSKPGFVDPKLPIVDKLTSIYNKVADDNRKPFYEGAITYARLLPNAVAFGPHFPGRKLPFEDGRGKEHMPDECVSIQSLLDAIKIYVKSVLAIDEFYK